MKIYGLKLEGPFTLNKGESGVDRTDNLFEKVA